MTTLLDVTIQHTGWLGGTFATGGWNDFFPLTVTGLPARSAWAHVLNGQAIDMAASFRTATDSVIHPYWFNNHTTAILQVPTVPSPYLVPSNEGVNTYTRVPTANAAALWRLVVSDQPTTPAPTPPPCQYGTQISPGNPAAVVLTASLIDLVVSAIAFPELAVFFAPLIGTSFVITQLCGTQPPPFPVLSPDWTQNSPGLLLQAFSSVAWPYFCQCVPGSPAPINFPPPAVVIPPGTPVAPTFPCDPANLCASIERIEQLLNRVSGTLNSNYQLTTLLQRYSLPFGVVPGLFHTGITDTGSVTVGRLIGLSYQVDVLPNDVRVLPGVTPYIRDLGWVGFTLPSGAVVEHRVTRQQELWMPDEAQLATQIGWSLTPGTSITIRELLAET